MKQGNVLQSKWGWVSLAWSGMASLEWPEGREGISSTKVWGQQVQTLWSGTRVGTVRVERRPVGWSKTTWRRKEVLDGGKMIYLHRTVNKEESHIFFDSRDQRI